MTRTRSFAAGIFTFSAAAMFALAGAGAAYAAPPASDGKTAPAVASAAVDSTGAAEYWTAERMRAAVPGDVLAGNAIERRATLNAAVDSAKDALKDTIQSKVKDKVKKPKPGSATSGNPKLAVKEDPVDHIGKVFFTMGGFNYVCSGNAVTSANKSTVATAGHCLNAGPGADAVNFIFVPGYDNGVEPEGRWTARSLHTTSQWKNSGDIAFDTGFAVMNELNGKKLTDVVGSSDVAFGLDRGEQYTSYGYPASAPYDGVQLWSCKGAATDDNRNKQFQTQGIPCTMNGGSSGGPWLLDDGVQNSINSYGYNGSGVMYGPYWGPEIESAYTFAQAA